MPRYSIDQLVTRANTGNIGRRGLRRLALAGLNPDELAQSGVQSPLNVNPDSDLASRRAALYANAVQAAHDLPQGQELSAGFQRRLALGGGATAQPGSITPHSAQEVQAFQGDNYNSLLDALRKRSAGIASKAPVYRY